MSIQYRDGTFSSVMPFEDALLRFNQEAEEGFPLKALHVGTEKQIKSEKDKCGIELRVDELETKIRDMSPVKTSLVLPTADQIRMLSTTNSIE